MDEAPTGLDPEARPFIWDRIYDLHRERLAMFLTTQDLDEVDTFHGPAPGAGQPGGCVHQPEGWGGAEWVRRPGRIRDTGA